MGKPFYAYILICADRSFYVGSTDDLRKRLGEHASGIGCSYTSKRLPIELAWFQEFSTRQLAKDAEAQLKGWSRAKKEALIVKDFDSISALSKKKDWAAYRERRLMLSRPSFDTAPVSPTQD